jgi:hypothetical protein
MIALGLNNVVDVASLSASIAFSTALPLANVQSPWLPLVARSLSAAAFSLTLEWSSPQVVGVVLLANHNFGWNAKLRISWSLNSTVLGRSGDVLVWPFRNGSVLSATEKLSFRPDFTFFLPDNVRVDQVIIEVFQPVASGFVQLGRVFVGEALVPALGVEYGAVQLGLVSRSSVQSSPAGFKFGSKLMPLREASVSLSALSSKEAFDKVFEAQRRADLLGEVVFAGVKPEWVALPAMGALAVSSADFSQCFLANFKEFNPLSQAFFNGFGGSVAFAEVAV